MKRRRFRPVTSLTGTPTFDQFRRGRVPGKRSFEQLTLGGGSESECSLQWMRHCTLQSASATGPGGETEAWTAGVGTYDQSLYSISIANSGYDVGESKLCYGLKFDTHYAASNGVEWFSTYPSFNDQDQLPVHNLLSQVQTVSGATFGFPPGKWYTVPHRLGAHPSSHLSTEKVDYIVFPLSGLTLSNMRARVRHYQVMHNGSTTGGVFSGCDEDDWSQTIGNLSGSVGGRPYTVGWDVTGQSARYKFTRNVRFGVIVWLELQRMAAGSYSAAIDVGTLHNANSLGNTVSVGRHGVVVGCNSTFRAADDSYRLTFTGGTWRPHQSSSSDTFEFSSVETGHTIAACQAECTASPARDGIKLAWYQEIPFIKIELGGGRTVGLGQSEIWYAPVADDYVDSWQTTLGGTTHYYYHQHPGGPWNGKSTTSFVPWFDQQTNTTGTFTPVATTGWPTSIAVSRI